MKYLLFTLAFIFAVPTGAIAMRTWQKIGPIMFALLILAPVLDININFLSHEWYRGDTRGIEIDLTDVLSLALLFGMAISSKYKKLRLFPPNSIPFILFATICLISISQSFVPLYGSFTFVRILRGWLLYVVAYNYLRNTPGGMIYALKVLAIAVAYQTYLVLKQKYLYGVFRVYGAFPHPNTLSMYMEIILPIILATLLHAKLKWQTFFWAAVLGGILCVISTFSRAGLVILGGALFMTIALSIWQRASSRKMMIVTVFVIIAFAGLIKAGDSIVDRFLNAPKSSAESRDNFNEAANAMASENTFGIGLNNYSHALKNTSYAKYINYVEAEAGVCHHIYWLYAGETGYPGLVAFVFLLAGFYLRALKASIKRKSSFNRAIAIGILASYSAMHLHGFTEWVFRQAPILYLFFLISAMLMSALEQIRTEERISRQRPRHKLQ